MSPATWAITIFSERGLQGMQQGKVAEVFYNTLSESRTNKIK